MRSCNNACFCMYEKLLHLNHPNCNCHILRASMVQRQEPDQTLFICQVAHYPAPEHRTAALAQQAAGLYLALYFVPGVLHRDATLMRTLVDRSGLSLQPFIAHTKDSWHGLIASLVL